MAQRPPRPCTHPGCPALVRDRGSKCSAHRTAYDQQRGSAAQRGYDGAWQRCRALFIAKHPICCEPGCGQPTIDVDHIQDVRSRPDLRLSWSNLRPFCHPHHSARTIMDQGANRGKARR